MRIDARLYLVATPALCARGLVETVSEAVAGGVGLVQLRDKEADDARFLETARALVAACPVPVLLNDRVHLVAAAGAAGAHVGEADLAPGEARRMLGPDAILGVSTHDRDELAALRDADYAGLGPIYPTRTKTLARRPRGPDLIRKTAGATRLPVFPIGGIDAANLPALVAAGATRAAVSSAICAAADPRAAAAALRALLPRE